MQDRLDMTIYMERVDDLKKVLSPGTVVYDSAQMRDSISKAVAFKRTRESNGATGLSNEAQSLLIKYHERGKLSMRAYEKLVGISRTIADLDNSDQIMKKHILEAFTYQTSMQIKRFFE